MIEADTVLLHALKHLAHFLLLFVDLLVLLKLHWVPHILQVLLSAWEMLLVICSRMRRRLRTLKPPLHVLWGGKIQRLLNQPARRIKPAFSTSISLTLGSMSGHEPWNCNSISLLHLTLSHELSKSLLIWIVSLCKFLITFREAALVKFINRRHDF